MVNFCHLEIFIRTGWLKTKISGATEGPEKNGSFYTISSHHKSLVEEGNNTKPIGIELECEFLSSSMAQDKLHLGENGYINPWL